jgi:hypothetical protein
LLCIGSRHIRCTAASIHPLSWAISGSGQSHRVSSECQPPALLLLRPGLARSRPRIARARPALTAALFGIVCAMTSTAKVSVMSGATFTSRVMASMSAYLPL